MTDDLLPALKEGLTRTLPRAQQVATDTYGGVKTIIGKGATITVEILTPTTVTLKVTGPFYDTARDGSYAIAMARRLSAEGVDNDGWNWDAQKQVWKRPCVYSSQVVRISTALRLFGLD